MCSKKYPVETKFNFVSRKQKEVKMSLNIALVDKSRGVAASLPRKYISFSLSLSD